MVELYFDEEVIKPEYTDTILNKADADLLLDIPYKIYLLIEFLIHKEAYKTNYSPPKRGFLKLDELFNGLKEFLTEKKIDIEINEEELKELIKKFSTSEKPIFLIEDDKISLFTASIKYLNKIKSLLLDKEGDQDPFIKLARLCKYRSNFFYDSELKSFYIWNGEGYELVIDDSMIISTFYPFIKKLFITGKYLPYGKREQNFFEKVYKNISEKTLNNRMLNAMKIVGMEKPKKIPKSWIKFKNCVYNLDDGSTFETNKEFLYVNPIPWKLGKSEETPTIDKLFEEWVGKERKQMLYELVAYCLYRGYPIHRIFFLVGYGRNGKSSFLRLLKKFLGADNVVSTDIERLETNRFETSRLFNKLLAICGETHFSVIKKSSMLKALVGEDLIPAEFKFKNRFEFINYAKIVIATNSLPMTLDTTDGFFSRCIIIDFPNQFDEGKDVIESIPEEEFENLARKCLRILKELLERGRFTGEGTVEEKREYYESHANPIKMFIKKYCVFEPEGYIPSTEFYNKFIAWLKAEKPRFRTLQWKSDVKPVLESMGLETGVRKWVGDTQLRCIVGIKWKEEDEEVKATESDTCDSKVEEDAICDRSDRCDANSLLILSQKLSQPQNNRKVSHLSQVSQNENFYKEDIKKLEESSNDWEVLTPCDIVTANKIYMEEVEKFIKSAGSVTFEEIIKKFKLIDLVNKVLDNLKKKGDIAEIKPNTFVVM